MSTLYLPAAAAREYYASCVRYDPGFHSGALWDFQGLLPEMVEAQNFLTNGHAVVIKTIEQKLSGGLHSAMLDRFGRVQWHLTKAAEEAASLPSDFIRVHADAIARLNTRGGHVADVGPAQGARR